MTRRWKVHKNIFFFVNRFWNILSPFNRFDIKYLSKSNVHIPRNTLNIQIHLYGTVSIQKLNKSSIEKRIEFRNFLCIIHRIYQKKNILVIYFTKNVFHVRYLLTKTKYIFTFGPWCHIKSIYVINLCEFYIFSFFLFFLCE